jgi:hypothetical protein
MLLQEDQPIRLQYSHQIILYKYMYSRLRNYSIYKCTLIFSLIELGSLVYLRPTTFKLFDSIQCFEFGRNYYFKYIYVVIIFTK